MIAALFVLHGGPYYGLEGVEPWGLDRDARAYNGPYPVIAHPPCERWGRYDHGGPASRDRKVPGDDGGCFEAALSAVRRWGGVLEHPADSKAWPEFGLIKPKRYTGWTQADNFGGLTCYVEQGHYGHRARKGTWLYSYGCDATPLIFGPGPPRQLDPDLDAETRRRVIRTGICQRLSARQRKVTPGPFRDQLIRLVETCSMVSVSRG